MTSNFDIGELARVAKVALDAQTKGQEFMLDDVHNVIRTAYERYPEDPVIRQVAFAVEKMAEKASPGMTINQAEVSNLYNHFIRLGTTKFRDILGYLLLEDQTNNSTQNPNYTKMNRVDAETSGITSEDLVNTNLVKALSSVFGSSIDAIKAFDDKIAREGAKFVAAELNTLGFSPQVDIMGGDQEVLVYAAHFETRKGKVTIAIPTEVKNGRVLFPSTFVADDHLKELTSANLNYFVDKKSETDNFSIPKASDVLAAVGILTGKARTAQDTEIKDQLDKLFGNSEGDISLNTPALYLDRKYEDGRPDINTTQQVEMPQELAHLARDFEDDILEAASEFGLEAIRNGKEMIARELRTAGFKNAQVKFGSESNDSVVYLVAINTPRGPAEIEVPIEMQSVAADKYIPLTPTYFAYDGLIEDFTAPKLQRFAVNLPAPSSGTKVYASAHSYMILPELKDEILKAASEGDYVTCEAALGQVQERFSEEDFKNAVADYHFILMQKAHLEHTEAQTCSKMIPAGKGSIYARCGHYGVPMHKVVIGEDGSCRLKATIEREKLNPVEDGGAAISTSKIFMA